MIYVLAGRGPDAVLAQGSTLQMVLDRPITFTERELNSGSWGKEPATRSDVAGAGDNGLALPRRK
jgi:hypothetical protein